MIRHGGTDYPRGARVRRHGRSGQVLILMILALPMLAGVVFYAYNVGHQVNDRLAMQNSADAVALAGANWIARSYNVVAMDNVGMAKCVAVVPILDSMPLASKMAHEEVTSWEQALAGQINRGFPNQAGEGPLLSAGFENLRARMAQQRDILGAFSAVMNDGGFNMQDITFWMAPGGGGPPSGRLWQAAVAMDNFSQATIGVDFTKPSYTQIATAGVLSQMEAARYGKANHAEVAFLTPIIPRVPVKRGSFQDFSPVLRNQLAVSGTGADIADGDGGAIPDWAYPHRLGPYARLHRWRDVWTVTEGGSRGTYVQDSQVRGGHGVNPGGRRVGSSARGQSSGHWVGGTPGTSRVVGYTTYGPYSWAMRELRRYAIGDDNMGELSDTFFWDYLSTLSNQKLKYMFRPQNQPAQLAVMHYPRWETDYNTCVQLGARPDVRVTRTLVYMVEVASSVPEGGPGWLTPGTYRANMPPPNDRKHRPLAIWMDGWNDPASWGIPKVRDYMWKDSYWYETTADPEIGIQPQTDANGEPIWQKVYMVSWYAFGGIDVGGEVEIRNPANWDEFDALPSPLLLDTSMGDYDPNNPGPDGGIRRALFTYLGTAKVSDKAGETLGGRFSSANPAKATSAVAQAEVYNRQSWDLWTQSWGAQLVPVTRWSEWMTQLSGDLDLVNEARGVIMPDQVRSVYDFMSRLSGEWADAWLHH
jgi:hypothetical protein